MVDGKGPVANAGKLINERADRYCRSSAADRMMWLSRRLLNEFSARIVPKRSFQYCCSCVLPPFVAVLMGACVLDPAGGKA